jgi:hypothetical protein
MGTLRLLGGLETGSPGLWAKHVAYQLGQIITVEAWIKSDCERREQPAMKLALHHV